MVLIKCINSLFDSITKNFAVLPNKTLSDMQREKVLSLLYDAKILIDRGVQSVIKPYNSLRVMLDVHNTWNEDTEYFFNNLNRAMSRHYGR